MKAERSAAGRAFKSHVTLSLSGVVVVLTSIAASCGTPKARNLGGEIHGFVAAALAKQDLTEAARIGAPPIRLPNITVRAKNVTTNALSVPVKTNANGHFITPKLPTGRYQLCLDASGFVSNWSPTVLDVLSEKIVLNFDPLIVPEPGVVRGRVMLQDAAVTACFAERPVFGTLVTGRVWLTDGSGNQVAGPVTANTGGEYVLPKIPGAGSYHLKGSCEGAQADRSVTFAAGDLAGAAAFEVTVQNHSPLIVSLSPTIGGRFVNRADPGATVKVTVQASDPDGDRLHYKWASDTPNFASVDEATIDWKLPNATAVNVVTVQVSDGKGGYAFRSARVESGPNQVSFGGVVRDRNTGAVISGANVTLATTSGTQNATTDANGNFAMAIPESLRYVVNVNKIGYALLSRIFFASATGLDLLLSQAQMATFPAEQGGTITFERKAMVTVKIGPGTLIDRNGKQATGSVRGYAFAYDLDLPNPIPGDLSAKSKDGRDVRLESYGAIDVTLTDLGGNKLQLASGETADISLTVHPASKGTAKAAIPLLKYDERTGYWIEEGELRLNGDRYEGKVRHFTAFNADTVFTNSACIQFNVADHDVPPFPFVLRVDYTSSAGGPRHNDFQVTQTNNGLVRLPPNTDMTITLYPGSGPGAPNSSSPHVLGTFHWNSGGATGNDTYPVADLNICNGFDTAPLGGHPAKPADVVVTVPGHDTYITGFGAGDQAISDAYYTALGVLGGPTARNNFTNWKATNLFNSDATILVAGEANAQYFNNGDLQLGRDMHCLKNVVSGRTKVACYVSNYGNGTNIVQGDPQFGVQTAVDHSALPAATVAMEFDDRGQTPPPVDAVQFYAYKGNGDSFENPALDNEGQKFLPQNCMACHGGSYNPGTNKVEGASFLAFDVFSFIYDNRAAKQKSLEEQQEPFRQLNSMVKATKPNNTNADNPIGTFIDGMYSGCNVDLAGCRAQDGPTATHPIDGGPYTPSQWQNNATTIDLYQKIPRLYCRTCHLAQSSTFPPDWTAYAQMTNSGNKSAIQFRVCAQTETGGVSNGTHKLMPHAEVPYKAFWFSSNPSGPAFLGDPTTGLGLTPNTSGDPCPR